MSKPHDVETVADASGAASQAEPAIPRFEGAERFLDQELIGRGGMGTVRRVYDRSLLREVALKRLEGTGDDGDAARFVTEAQITAQLDHPNIVPIHDLLLGDPAAPSYLMKLVGGRTFASHIAAAGPPPRSADELARLLDVFLKVCDAIAFAHSRDVMHRDLKPHNVMVDTYGRVYVVDWGLARYLRRGPGGAILGLSGVDEGGGTPHYMAAEQALPGWKPVGPWTDVFALGAMLFEILVGRPPYDAATPREARQLAFVGKAEIPEAALAPPALARIARRALSREPEERHASVDELRTDVERFLRGVGRERTLTFDTGERIITEGEVGDAAYVIVRGRCRAFKTVDGQQLPLRVMGPGEVFGETAVFLRQQRTASVEALEPVLVHEVDRQTLEDGLGLHTWMGAFVRALAARFMDVDSRLTQITRDSSRG